VTGRARGAIQNARRRLPIRLKLAIVSAALTFVILVVFATVVGAVTDRRLKANFDDDLRATAADVRDNLRLRSEGGQAQFRLSQKLLDVASAGGASIRVVDNSNTLLGQSGKRANLGSPFDGIRDFGAYRVTSRPLFAESLDPGGIFGLDPRPIDGAVAFVQFARPRDSIESTSDRLHLFLALGVLGGTGLAFLAGFAVARRAMRPIAGLTRAAREVAVTRDPGKTLPRPQSNDEVAELALTLEEMLRQLDAARGESEAALQRQRDFVADASHELRTPLTSILANLEMLEEGLAGGESTRDREASEIASSALRSSRRMRRLVGDLLLLARADAGREAPRREVDLGAVAREAVTEAAPLASGHAVSIDVPDEPVLVDGSADDLHRLVLNLVENALIHTPHGTPVVVSLRPREDLVHLEVADRGPGIPPAARHKIFDRFARHTAETADAAPTTGSGLGLAIVRAVAEAHDGTVEATEAPGGGALFTVTIPAASAVRSTSGRVPDRQAEPSAEPKGAKIS